jgi:hypothetical protein
VAEHHIKSETLINYLEKQRAYEAADAARDAAKDELEGAKLDLWEALKDAPDTHIERDLGPPWGIRRFTPGQTIYARIYNEDALRKYLEQTKLSREILGDAIRKGPLNVRVRRALKNPNVPMPDGVEHADTKYITVKQVRKKG